MLTSVVGHQHNLHTDQDDTGRKDQRQLILGIP